MQNMIATKPHVWVLSEPSLFYNTTCS